MLKFTKVVALLLIIGSGIMAQEGSDQWSMYRGKSDLSGRTDDVIPSKPSLIWSIKTNSRTVSSPVISKGISYFGNNNGTIHAIDSRGDLLWKYETETSIEASPVILDDKVIFGALDGDLRALDTKTGKLVWTYATENQIVGSVNIWQYKGKKLIVFGSYDFALHCVDPASGKREWILETDNFIHGTPAISRSGIVFGGCDGLLRHGLLDRWSGRWGRKRQV